MRQQIPETRLFLLRFHLRRQKAVRRSRLKEAGWGRLPSKLWAQLWGSRELPRQLRQMDSARREPCEVASAQWLPVLPASAKWHESMADRHAEWLAGYPPAMAAATDVLRSASRKG